MSQYIVEAHLFMQVLKLASYISSRLDNYRNMHVSWWRPYKQSRLISSIDIFGLSTQSLILQITIIPRRTYIHSAYDNINQIILRVKN